MSTDNSKVAWIVLEMRRGEEMWFYRSPVWIVGNMKRRIRACELTSEQRKIKESQGYSYVTHKIETQQTDPT